MSEPVTEAGRRLLADPWLTNPYGEANKAMRAAIAAIEAEARNAALDEVAAALARIKEVRR